jgi:2-keto-4-pentenoate hydratase/2-oxohepta-3-ene-1,7-dioic acid hydratase in catechol pathway
MGEAAAGGAALLERMEAAAGAYDGAVYALDRVEFGNVTSPGKIVCAGLNYKSHAEETGGQAPEYPVLFSKFGDALSPSGAPVALPGWRRCYDYEAELVVVVGARAYNVPPEDAAAHIFGYTCGNDLSARDSQFLSSQWLSGKSFPGFAPAGPFIVTADCFDPSADNAIVCRVNGESVQNGVTSDMIFTCAETLSAASRCFPLEPGDLIFTGTPAGVILGKPKGRRVWLRPGDTVEVAIEGIGTLVTPLIAY